MTFMESDTNGSEIDVNLYSLTTGFGQLKFLSMTRKQKQYFNSSIPIKRTNSKQNIKGKLIRQPW